MHGLVRSSMAIRHTVRNVLVFAAGAAIAVVFAAQVTALVDSRGQCARLLVDRERDQRASADLVRSEHQARTERDRTQAKLESALAELAATTKRLDYELQRTAAAINRDLLNSYEHEHARSVRLAQALEEYPRCDQVQ
jgi:hypothetical protein